MLRIIDRLKCFESMLWKDIVGKTGSHWIAAHKLYKPAQKCLEEDWQGADEIFSLRIDGPTRVFGVIDDLVFYLLWYDRNHEICPAPKKNT